jgi:hypothetical protein
VEVEQKFITIQNKSEKKFHKVEMMSSIEEETFKITKEN